MCVYVFLFLPKSYNLFLSRFVYIKQEIKINKNFDSWSSLWTFFFQMELNLLLAD